jgi:two-component system, LuxR family, response regulator FixJ
LSRSADQIVIVVDDDSQIRESLQSLLHAADFVTAVFSSAEDALRSGLAAQASCLITDVRMPGMNGLELLRRIKQDDPRLPVIMISGHHDEHVRVAALADGAVMLLYKPFDPDDLLAIVQTAIDGSPKVI